LSVITSNKYLCCIAGDFNIDLLKAESHAPTADFINCIFSHSFYPVINKPTRVTETSATLIDNIFTNFGNAYKHVPSILCSDISDHLPIYINLVIPVPSKPNKYIYKRIYSDHNKQKFINSLQNTVWNENKPHIENSSVTANSDTMYTLFISKFTQIFDNCFPLKKVNTSKKNVPRKPWITTGLAKSCSTKEKLYKLFITNPSQTNKMRYTKFRNKLNTLLKKAEQSYYREKFDLVQTSMKQTWQTIKGILNVRNSTPVAETFYINNQSTNDKILIAKKFNDFFVNIGPTLAAKIPASNVQYSTFLNGNFKNSFMLFNTDVSEVISVARNLKSKTSSGYDDIPVDIAKLSIYYVAPHLVNIINKSFSDGQVPDLLKIAKVCPIFKTGDKCNISNYRPISVLPSFSKIFEKLVYNRVINFLTKHSILYSHQYGFRSNHSTSMAVLEMIDKITDAMDNNKFSIGLFIDLSKAFDTINHKILLDKLHFYGIRGIALDWFKSYLQNRKQYVLYNGTSSSLLPVTCGVPQGSILGPILFLLYVNDIVNVSSLLHLVLFADDTNIFMSGKNLDLLIRTLNHELKLLHSWFIANKLSLNIEKTHYIIFTGQRKKYDASSLTQKVYFDDKPIGQVTCTKFLGIYIDEHLSWSVHIDHVKSKISKTCGILNKLKHKVPQSILLLIYNSLILPYLQYCAMVWVCNVSNQNNLNSLLIIQKRAVRNITRSKYQEHAAPLFKKLNLLTIHDICFMQISEFMFKFNKNLLPHQFSKYFERNSAVYNYETRHSNLFHIQHANTSKRINTVRYIGPRNWKKIPGEITSAVSLSVFKKKLKANLIEKYV